MTAAPWRVPATGHRQLAAGAVLILALTVAAVISDPAQWQPTTLVVALAVVMVLADVAVVWSRSSECRPA